MIAYLLVVLLVVFLLSWLWRTDRDPLVYLVPPALAFSPMIRYAGETFGAAGAWLSVRKALVLTLGISLAFRFLKGDYAWRRIPGVAFVAPYVCLVLLSVLWSVGPSNNDAADILNEFIDWAVPVAVFFCLAASPSSDRRIASTGRVLAFTVVMVAIYSGFQFLALAGISGVVPAPIADLTLQGHDKVFWASYRVYGPFVSTGPNALGVFLLLPAAYALNRVVDASGRTRLGWALVVLVAAAVIAGTYSRAAQLGLIVIVIILPLLRRSPGGVAFTSVSLLLVAAVLAETRVGQHFRSLYGGGDLFDPDVGYRFSLWRVLLTQIADHPFGFGFNGWTRASQHLVVAGLSTLPGAPQPGAGQWMRELADRGIAGTLALALLMAGLIVLTVRGAHQSRPRGVRRGFLTAAAAGFAAWMVAFSSDDYLALDTVAGLFWYVAGTALGALRDDVVNPLATSQPADSSGGATTVVAQPAAQPHIPTP